MYLGKDQLDFKLPNVHQNEIILCNGLHVRIVDLINTRIRILEMDILEI